MGNMNRRNFLRFICAGTALTILPEGCGKDDSPLQSDIFEQAKTTDLKVMVVGVDGATFDIIEPMIAAGKLPEFKRLMSSGTYARFRSQRPMFSPVLWTTIATGHNRKEHGIRYFVTRDEDGSGRRRLISTRERQRQPLWNIVSPFKKSVGAVGWWVTWPVEPVNGFTVSDRVAHSRWASWTNSQPSTQLTFPKELLEEIKELIVDPQNPPMEEIDRLVMLTAAEKEEMLAAKKPLFAYWLTSLKFGYCAQRTYEKVALHMLERSQPDLSMVFLIGIDPVCHTFWHFFKPWQFPEKVDPAQAERLGRVIPAMYEHTDNYLKELLSMVDSNTVVFVVSDHGFQPTGQLPRRKSEVDYRRWGVDIAKKLDRAVNIGMSGMHHIDGVFIASGGPILRGTIPIEQPSITDIVPTVLVLMGLPVGRDMPGRVLSELIDLKFLAAHPVRYIDSYENHIKRPAITVGIDVGENEQIEYLRSLGYVK